MALGRTLVLAPALALALAACGGTRAAAPTVTGGVGPEVNVSQAAGSQAETMITVDPVNPQVLLAGANDILESNLNGVEAGFGGMRAFSSTDGGATWTGIAALPLPGGITAGDGCTGDPSVAIDTKGRQYYAFIHMPRCQPDYYGVQTYVARRAGPTGTWTVARTPIAPLKEPYIDDKVMLAVDAAPSSPHVGRVYVLFSRETKSGAAAVISHTDDGGARWSGATRVSPVAKKHLPVFASAAVLADGSLVAIWELADTVYASTSRNGTVFGGATRLGRLDIPTPEKPKKGHAEAECKGLSIPAQTGRCVSAGPTVVADRSTGPHGGTAYAAWIEKGPDATTDVVAVALDRSLKVTATSRFTGPVVSDQFQPALAVDQGTGTVWLCWYDTSGDRSRVHALFVCTGSSDGGQTWATPIPAATIESDATKPGLRTWFNYGDYQGVVAAGGVAHPIWTDARSAGSDGTEIYTTAIRESALTRGGK